jgi:RNA polymerase sigma-70 factor (ECF subfamily)
MGARTEWAAPELVSDSDTALVARVIKDDDRGAFELLVRRHQSALRNFLRRLAKGDAARADDLAQETFIKTYASLSSFTGRAKFSTWLYRIAYTTFLNDQRGRRPQETFDETEHPDPAGMESAAVGWDIDRLLSYLSPRQRAIFDLHFKKGMTHQEIATALDVPIGTVKSDLLRGQDTLRNLVSDRKGPTWVI